MSSSVSLVTTLDIDVEMLLVTPIQSAAILFWKKKKEWVYQRNNDLKVLLKEFHELHTQNSNEIQRHYNSIQKILQMLLNELTILKNLYYYWLLEEYKVPLSSVSSYMSARNDMTADLLTKNDQQIQDLVNVLSAIIPSETIQWLRNESHLQELIHSLHLQGATLTSIIERINQWKSHDETFSSNVWQEKKYSSCFWMSMRYKRFIDLMEAFTQSTSMFDHHYYRMMNFWTSFHDILADKEPFDWLASNSTMCKPLVSRNHRALIKHLTRVIHCVDKTLSTIVHTKGGYK